jgi:hypothetical protein
VPPVHRTVVLLALAACEPTADAPDRDTRPPATWVYPPPPSAFPLGASQGWLGRSQPPQPMTALGIASAAGPDAGLAALHLATAWPIPGEGPARAVIYGSDGDRGALELVDIDAGRVMWRDRATCAAPIVATTRDAIVCADGSGTQAVGLDGALLWTTPSPVVAVTGARIVASGIGAAIILDAATGDEIARVVLPRGVAPGSIIASCGDTGRELLALGADRRLVRITEAKAGPAISWAVPLDAPDSVRVIDACEHDAILVSGAGAERHAGSAGATLVAIARTTGKLTGWVDGVRGWWPARDGSDRLEIATALGVASYPRDLVDAPVPVAALSPLGELLAARGDRRLVRATPLTAVLLDRDGVRGYLPLAAMGVVLGDTALIASSGAGSPGETVHRFALPPRWNLPLWLPPRRSGVAAFAELRDLPAVRPLELGASIALPDTGMYAIGGHAIDPRDGAAVYAIAIDVNGERAGVARADLAAKRWRWQRTDGCGPGTPVAIGVAGDVVVCGATGSPGVTRATVRATSRDGEARWQWTSDTLDAVSAGGDVVVVHDAGRITVLDARDGTVIGHIASDDGAAVRAAIVALDGPEPDTMTLVITAERGRVVARLGIGGLLPVWSVSVAGTVRALAQAGTGVLVALEDGDAYRIDARTAAISAMSGLGLGWHAAGDLVTGDTLGGPIPAPAPPVAPVALIRPRAAALPVRPLPLVPGGDINAPPPMSTPIAAPPALGDSWQLTLYELAGGLRARNDYALEAPVAAPAVRGPAGSPLVMAYGPELREIVVIDPRTGDPLRRVRLPDDAPAGAVFGTVVDGSPVAGTLLASPLRVVLF